MSIEPRRAFHLDSFEALRIKPKTCEQLPSGGVWTKKPKKKRNIEDNIYKCHWMHLLEGKM